MDRVRRLEQAGHHRHHRLRAEEPRRCGLRRASCARDRAEGRRFVESPFLSARKGSSLPRRRTDQMGTVESVKAASDIFAPVSGVVKEVNTKLEDQANLLNRSPEQDGASTLVISGGCRSTDSLAQAGWPRLSSPTRPRSSRFSRLSSTPHTAKARTNRRPAFLSLYSIQRRPPIVCVAIPFQHRISQMCTVSLQTTWCHCSHVTPRRGSVEVVAHESLCALGPLGSSFRPGIGDRSPRAKLTSEVQLRLLSSKLQSLPSLVLRFAPSVLH